jgi:flavin-binding protein dodecin
VADNVYSILKIVGSSKDGVEDAIRSAVDQASKRLRNLD